MKCIKGSMHLCCVLSYCTRGRSFEGVRVRAVRVHDRRLPTAAHRLHTPPGLLHPPPRPAAVAPALGADGRHGNRQHFLYRSLPLKRSTNSASTVVVIVVVIVNRLTVSTKRDKEKDGVSLRALIYVRQCLTA